ncbi:MAG: amidinotransferase [Saprospirales bacterium]|nr:amidinotransferase [Saprospirales bacterium]MBK8491977.1 amidinotransferase [Saprospirales bacterium]
MRQTTSHILMVRPAAFGFNEQTAGSNAFQSKDPNFSEEEISRQATKEFDDFVKALQTRGVDVIVMQDPEKPVKPDAVFPNNWVTFHEDGTVILYPMFAPVRRLERNESFLDTLRERFIIKRRLHLDYLEAKEIYLEGTGSLILDRINRLAYACLSPRTNPILLDEFCREMDYDPVLFTAVDGLGKEIYHTNVMMALGETFVVICLDTIKDPDEKALVLRRFEETGKDIIEITLNQMLQFAGNMLQIRTRSGKPLLVMSEQAFQSLFPQQLERLKRHTDILSVPLNTIETYGGGSARCMMAEVFLPVKS